MRFLDNGREWGLLGLLYADDLVLCDESEEDLKGWWEGLLKCVEGEQGNGVEWRGGTGV